jgi:DNA polymerase-1
LKSWLKELDGPNEPPEKGAAPTSAAERATVADPAPAEKHYETILDWPPSTPGWQDRSRPLTALDTETTSLDPMVRAWSASPSPSTPGEAAYLPLAHTTPARRPSCRATRCWRKLKPWLESLAHAKLGQNLKYDRHVFANHGIALAGVAHDTLLQSYVLGKSDKRPRPGRSRCATSA